MKELKNTENCSDDLLAAYMAGEAGNDEKKLVEDWKNQSDKNHQLFSESRNVMEKAVIYYKTRQFSSETAWKNISSRIKQQSQFTEVQGKKQIRAMFAPLLRYAAILIFVAVSGTMIYYLSFRNNPAALIQIRSTNQVLEENLLPDGTRVALNSNSALYYPEKFIGSTREVRIEGEAFFEVVPDSTKPFIITAGKARIKVLGTSFNINAYPDKEIIEVIVRTGKVQVSLDSEIKDNKGLFLNPGEKGTLFNKNEKLVKSINSNLNFLAWKTRSLIFRETKMEEVIRSLEKIYPVTIRTNQSTIDSLKLNAQFDDLPIDYVLEVIRLTFRLELKSDNGLYTLSYPVN